MCTTSAIPSTAPSERRKKEDCLSVRRDNTTKQNEDFVSCLDQPGSICWDGTVIFYLV